MREYKGIIKTIGAGTAMATSRTGNLGTYSYIEIGDEIIHGPKAWSGIQGELSAALRVGEPVTLHMHGNYLVGITQADGRTFASGGDGGIDWMMFLIYLVIGIPLTLAVIGFFFLYLAWRHWQRIAAGFAASGLPGAIMI